MGSFVNAMTSLALKIKATCVEVRKVFAVQTLNQDLITDVADCCPPIYPPFCLLFVLKIISVYLHTSCLGGEGTDGRTY